MKSNKQIQQQSNKVKEYLGNRLAQIRKINNVSTYDLQLQGFRSQQYKAIESGKLNLTLSRIFKYCEAIGAEIKISNTLPLRIEVDFKTKKNNYDD